MDFSTSVTPAGSEAPTTEIESWRLVRASATELQLAMLGGTGTSQRGRITINGQVYTFTSAVSGTNGSLSNSTIYYVYAYISAGAVALEFSTTAPNLQTPDAYAIKNGDGTRRYVGKTKTDGSAQFTVDSTWSARHRFLATARLVNDLRLSASSTDATPLADQATAATIYLLPYVGNRISLYNGTSLEWEDMVINVASPPSLALSGLTSGKNYDIFAYTSGPKVTLELGAAWTNDTTRATALVTTDEGVLYKSGDKTRRYVGTMRASGTGTTEDTKTQRYLWNMYHRVQRRLLKTAGSDTYALSAVRDYANSAANKFELVTGQDQVIAVGCNLLVRGDGAAGIGQFGWRVDAGSDHLPLYGETGNYIGAGDMAMAEAAAGYHAVTMRQKSNGSGSGGTFASPEMCGVIMG